jgi:hypothetical protein
MGINFQMPKTLEKSENNFFTKNQTRIASNRTRDGTGAAQQEKTQFLKKHNGNRLKIASNCTRDGTGAA